MNELSIIEFEGSKIRCVGTPDRPEWVAADVCRALGIVNVSDALARLDGDEKGIGITDTPSGEQEMLTLTEPGLYKLVSRTQTASHDLRSHLASLRVIRPSSPYSFNLPPTH